MNPEEYRPKILANLLRDLPGSPAYLSAPLRVCPLGAHIDHQGGTVCGFPITKDVIAAWKPLPNFPGLRIHSADFPGRLDVTFDHIPPAEELPWGRQIVGIAAALHHALGHPLTKGVALALAGSLPTGSGLSSSAAVGLLTARILCTRHDINPDAWGMIDLTKYSENEYVGLNNGILDQTIISLGRKNAITFLDCKTRHIEQVQNHPDTQKVQFVLFNCGCSRQLLETGYNNRVHECQTAAGILQWHALPPNQIPLLSNVSPQLFQDRKETLPPNLRKRAEHYFGEMQRVEEGRSAWGKGEFLSFGHLMRGSARSSVEFYESGAPDINALVHLLNDTPGVLGARFCGGGFGGTAIALCEKSHIKKIEQSVHTRFLAQFPDRIRAFSVTPIESCDGLENRT